MIGLVLENEKDNKPLEDYVVSVGYVEILTGIDFFQALDDSAEIILEGNVDLSAWSFDHYSSSTYGHS